MVPCRALMRKSPRLTTMFFSRTRSFARALAGAQAAGEPMAVISKVPRRSGGRRTPPLRGTIPKLPAKKRGSNVAPTSDVFYMGLKPPRRFSDKHDSTRYFKLTAMPRVSQSGPWDG